MSRREALQFAEEKGLDLVEVSPNAEPPVCRVMDYGKFLFEKNKSQQVAKKKQKQIQVKEIKFRPGTDQGDYQVKLRNLIRFLSEGDKAKVTLRFRGERCSTRISGVNCSNGCRRILPTMARWSSFPKWKAARWSWFCPQKKPPSLYDQDINRGVAVRCPR